MKTMKSLRQRLLRNSLNLHPEERSLESRTMNLEVRDNHDNPWRIAYRWHASVTGSFDLIHASRVQSTLAQQGLESRLVLAEAN